MNKVLLIIVIFVFTNVQLYSQAGGVSVNDNGTPADPSAELDIQSVSRGLLIPRMTTAQRNAINSPALALQIFNTTTNCLEIYINSVWNSIFCGSPSPCGANTVSFTYKGSNVTYGTVTGQNNTCWLDRNLGALQVATAFNDVDAYGDLFQWGRLDDGHQDRSSTSTTILSSTDIPGHSQYIDATNYPPVDDWRSPQNNSLWQGVAGINNPCPTGWRLPSKTELANESLSWSSQDYYGAFLSPLKLTAGGARSPLITEAGITGFYWSLTLPPNVSVNPGAGMLFLNLYGTGTTDAIRMTGNSVRCILD